MDFDNNAMTMVPTRLGRLRVETYGSGDPAVLWHSLFVDSTSWDRVRESLAASRRLLIIDGPSHGGSDPVTRDFTLKDCAGAALDVLDHLGVTAPVDWVGNAWGGHVGILFAAAHPDRCRSLITIGTPIRALGTGERRQISALVTLYRLLGPVRPLLKPVLDGLLTPRTRSTDPDAVRLVTSALRGAERRGMYTAMRWVMLARQDLSETLPTVTSRTLIVTSDDLAVLTPAEARDAATCMPDGASAMVPGARHLAPLENPSAVIDLITGFWQGRSIPVTSSSRSARPGPSRFASW